MTEEARINPTSSFYLGAGDQPGNIITHVVLKGDNYLAWSCAITLSLKSRHKFGFIDGTVSKPTETKKSLDWETVNSMLVTWILRTIEPRIVASFPYFDEASKLWSYLERRYYIANGPRLQQLRAAITGCQQSKTMSVATLMGLYDDLNRLKPPHGCECGSYSCNLADKYARDREEEIFHQFLVGIDAAKYAVVKSNLLSQQPPPTLDDAYQAFIQEERSRAIAHTKEKEPAHIFALPSDRKQTQSKVDKSKLFCTHYRRSGHETSGCFLLHGYPDWWIEKSGKTGGAVSSGQSATTHGSRASASPAAASSAATTVRPTARENAVGSPLCDASSNSLPMSTDMLQAISTLQPENVRALMALINNQNQDKMSGESLILSWIIDTGASHHVTGDDTCLFDVHFICPCPVGLPDGATSLATKEGRVYLAEDIILEKVLFVPKLTCNLISVSKMVDDSHCFVKFTDSLCAIQDQRSGNLIGAGEPIDGLLFFRQIPKVCAVQDPAVSTFELWHRRLGHPSDKILKLVPALQVSSSRHSMNKPCEVCPQAKQTRDSFPDSDSRAH
ncbi:Retrovirus-related Pol polyprotein from transposon RE2 [Bienertia sinuspersici]